jgi:predicted transposase YdaD
MKREDVLDYLRGVMAYLSGIRKRVKREEIEKAMQEVFAQEEFDKSALFIQEWMEEGREKGREEGLHTGLLSLTLRLARHHFGQIEQTAEERIRALSSRQLEDLGEALLEFASVEDLNQWLGAHPAESPTQPQ